MYEHRPAQNQAIAAFLWRSRSSWVHNKSFLYTRARASNLPHMSLRHMTACAYWRGRTGGERAAGQRILLNLSRHSCEMRPPQPFRFVITPTLQHPTFTFLCVQPFQSRWMYWHLKDDKFCSSVRQHISKFLIKLVWPLVKKITWQWFL